MRIIRGKYGRRRFDVPRNISARPTTDFARENIFNVLECRYDFDDTSALDLFAGTGAISFEFLSRGCRKVVAVENTSTQFAFIKSVAQRLNVGTSLTVLKTDAFKFIECSDEKFDFIFADPPYDHPGFGEIPSLVLSSGMLKPGTVFIMEHSKNYDFSDLPHFTEHRVYGSVNFSIFQIPDSDSDNG